MRHRLQPLNVQSVVAPSRSWGEGAPVNGTGSSPLVYKLLLRHLGRGGGPWIRYREQPHKVLLRHLGRVGWGPDTVPVAAP